MAKDRAKDPKRVPSLGISDPISHVNVVESGTEGRLSKAKAKFDSEWGTDAMRHRIAAINQNRTARHNQMERDAGRTPVVKINTDPTDK